MTIVKDVNGVEWLVSVTPASLLRVQSGCQFDLCAMIVEAPQIDRFVNNLVLPVEVLYWLCQPQAEQRKVTHDAWLQTLWSGDAIEAAQFAILEALRDFFPRSRQAPLDVLRNKLREALEQIQPAAPSLPSSTAAMKSGESSESTPATTL